MYDAKYDGIKFISERMPDDGKWNYFVDEFGNTELCRLKFDIQDHFYPPTKLVKEESVIGWYPAN